MFEIFVFVYFAKYDFWRKRKASNKCILCILLKASISELWHNILLWCLDAITTPFDLEYVIVYVSLWSRV